MQAQATVRTRRDFVTWLSALSLTGLARPLAANGALEDEAENAARAWLKIVETGGFGRSWDEASPAFKDAITKEQWLQALDAARSPLGSCLSRKRVARRLVESLPGAPKGPFVVIRYASEFLKKADAVETITPALDSDGRWRIAGYYIK